MILQHIANRPGFVIEGATALYTEALRHGDLHTFHVVAVPDRFKEGVVEPEEDQVLDCVLAKVVIDAEDSLLVENLAYDRVQRHRRFQVMSKRLLDDDTRTVGAAGLLQLLQHLAEEAWRYRKIVQRMLCGPQLLAHLSEGRNITIVAVHISQQAH